MHSASFKYGVILVISMTDYTLKVKINQEDRGLGFSAKKALANQAGLKHSPIVQARLVDSDSAQSTLEVTVSLEDAVGNLVKEILSKSGQIPERASYSVEQVTLVAGAPPVAAADPDKIKLFESNVILKSQLTARTNELEVAQQEIGLLASRLEETKYAGVDNPVNGILSYFSTQSMSLSRLIESDLDSIFAIKVLRKEIANTLQAYIRHMDGSAKSDEEIDSVLNANVTDLEKEKILHEQESDKMQAELVALERLKKGEISLPERLKELIIADVVSKDYPAQITGSKKAIVDIEKKKILRANFDKYRKMYDGLDERIELIRESHESMPVLFYSDGASIDVYLPIPVRNITPNFSDDITGYITKTACNTLAPHRLTCSVNKLAHDRFVAYKIQAENAEKINLKMLREVVDALLSDVPTSLKLAGYDRLVPHRIGI